MSGELEPCYTVFEGIVIANLEFDRSEPPSRIVVDGMAYDRNPDADKDTTRREL